MTMEPFDWRKFLTVQSPCELQIPYDVAPHEYVSRFERLNSLVPTVVPLCNCGNPCQFYGGGSGYSVSCNACNEEKAAKQRSRRAKAKR